MADPKGFLKNGREVAVMYEEIDEKGCRHWALEDDGEDQE